MNDKKNLLTVAAIGLLVIGAIIYWLTGTESAPVVASQAFYTTDEGQTWFKDDIRKIPPFDHNGKPAYRCYLYTEGGKTVVAYLERYTDEARKVVEKLSQPGSQPDPIAMQTIMKGLEVKKPGAPDSEWVSRTDPKYAGIALPNGPTGSGVPVEP